MEMICILCPIGCRLKVIEEDGEIKVTGNACPRGIKYGISELTNPTRMVTSSVWIDGGDLPLVSIKTKSPIPRNKIEEVLKLLENLVLKSPIQIGDIIIENVADTGVDIVATRNIVSK